MVVPVIVKVGAVGWLLWEILKGKKPAATTPAPAPVVVPVVAPKPEAPGPVIGKRWTFPPSGQTYSVRGTQSIDSTLDATTYDALYAESDSRLVAIIDASTYDDNGDSAWVAAVVSGSTVKWSATRLVDGKAPATFPMTLHV